MFYVFFSISVICKIRFYFKLNLANASVCDSIKFQSIKTYLFYGHHILGPSVFIPGEINAVAVGYKGYTPSCFTSRNIDKMCTETPWARKHGFNHCLHSFTCIFLPLAAYQSVSLVKTKITPAGVHFFSHTFYLSSGTVVVNASNTIGYVIKKKNKERKKRTKKSFLQRKQNYLNEHSLGKRFHFCVITHLVCHLINLFG